MMQFHVRILSIVLLAHTDMMHVKPNLKFSNNRSEDLMNKIFRYLNLPVGEDKVCYKQLPAPQEKRSWAKIIQVESLI